MPEPPKKLTAKGHYVYELIDPVSDEVFYVGKGKGRRMYQHAVDARAGRITNPEKHERITSIHALGLEVQYRIVKDRLTEDEALQLERETIARHGIHNLTNATPGQLTAARKAQLRAQYLVTQLKPVGPWLYAKRPAERRLAFDVMTALTDAALNGQFNMSTAVRKNRDWRARGGLFRGQAPRKTHA